MDSTRIVDDAIEQSWVNAVPMNEIIDMAPFVMTHQDPVKKDYEKSYAFSTNFQIRSRKMPPPHKSLIFARLFGKTLTHSSRVIPTSGSVQNGAHHRTFGQYSRKSIGLSLLVEGQTIHSQRIRQMAQHGAHTQIQIAIRFTRLRSRTAISQQHSSEIGRRLQEA